MTTSIKPSPLISVITITYNAAEALSPTMQSLAQQQFANFEHIIVDGASTDNTLGVARRMATANLRMLSEPDEGLYDAMNKGLGMARGKYLLFLNAGDRLASAATLGIYAKAAKNNPDIIYGDTVVVDAVGNILRPRHLSAPQILTAAGFAQGMLICHQAFMVKRDIAPKYNTSYKFSADYDWCIRCIKATVPQRCENLNCVTIHYLDGGLTVKNRFASLRERFKIMENHYGLLPTICNHAGFLARAISRKSL